MNETKGLVKCILGFLLSIIMIVGASVGLDVQVNIQDTAETPPEVVETYETNVEEVENEEGQEVLATEEVVETGQSPVEPTEAEDEEPTVDESV